MIDRGRLYVQLISSNAFASYMKFRGYTVRTLAAEVGCSPALVGHLRSGKRDTCRPDTAKKIAKCLNAPLDSLFVASVTCVVYAEGRAA